MFFRLLLGWIIASVLCLVVVFAWSKIIGVKVGILIDFTFMHDFSLY